MKIVRRADIHNVNSRVIHQFLITAVGVWDVELIGKFFCRLNIARTYGVYFGIIDDLKRCSKFVSYPARA